MNLSEPASYLPTKWTIKPTDPTVTKCPPFSAILGTFAAVNVIVAAIGILVGHRIVIKRLSCGLFGKRDSYSTWIYMWVVSAGLQVGSNAIVSTLMLSVPGYTNTFTVTELTLVFLARPRLGWLGLLVLGMTGREIRNPDYSRDFELPWANSAMTQVLCETVLQCIAFYPMSKVLSNGAYKKLHKYPSAYVKLIAPPGAINMEFGAAFFLAFSAIQTLAVIVTFCIDWKKRDGGGRVLVVSRNWPAAVILILTNAGSWIFWAGYVRLAGPS
jgi:hypothetical protein